MNIDELFGLWVIIFSFAVIAIIIDRINYYIERKKKFKNFKNRIIEDERINLENILKINEYIHIPS